MKIASPQETADRLWNNHTFYWLESELMARQKVNMQIQEIVCNLRNYGIEDFEYWNQVSLLIYKKMNNVSKKHTNCRVCDSSDLTKYLNLGQMPLANNNETCQTAAKITAKFPLEALFCNNCGLSQLSEVINPEVMFSNYNYRSAVNKGYVKHCQQMAVDLKNKFELTEDSFMIDIAGNDGTLLKQFKNLINLHVLNVDPAKNLTAIAELDGIDSITEFWNEKLAYLLANRADLITATNVFAHVDNVKEFISASKIALKKDGVLVLEFPYLVDFIEKFEFDTIYHEHLSYFSIIPLMKLTGMYDMKIISVEKQNIHGGTVRVTIAHEISDHQIESSVSEFVNNEIKLGYHKIDKYQDWSAKVNEIVANFKSKISELKQQGFKIAAFAASAKGNTLLNFSNIGTELIDFIADETPEKIGKFYSGVGIPIVNKQQIIDTPPDYIIILSWNFKDEIIEKLNKIYKGKYIIPIPSFEII